MSFKMLHVYIYLTKLCRQQAEVIQNHENTNVLDIRKGEYQHGTYMRLELAAVKRTIVQVNRQPL
jgi:hypothetical protein